MYISRTTNLNNSDWVDKQVSPSATNQDKPFIAVDNTAGTYDGRIYTVWTDFSTGSSIKFSYSSDHGVTFSTPQTLGSSTYTADSRLYANPSQSTNQSIPSTGAFVQGAMPSVGPNGELYVVWANFSAGYNQGIFYIKKSTNGGASFGSSISAAQFTASQSNIGKLDIRTYLSSVAVDPVVGYIYLVYADQVSQTNTNLRTKIVYSTDGGNTWSSPAVIADFGSGWQFFPWVSADKNGRVSVLLLNSSDLTNIDSYITESYNYGASFASPIRVSTQSSNPSNATWTHHYHGVTDLTGGDSYCIWTDYRNNNANPYFSLSNTLFYYATQNKSVNQIATSKNGQRKLVQDGSGNFHLVFSSGGEIFYRKSVSGTTWQDPVKISYVNGSNDYPCIALGYSNYIMVVWQRLTGTNTYDIYFSMSTDGGSTWSSANRYTLETSLSSSGPQSVIARNSNISLTTVSYVSSSGLKAKRTYSNLPPNLSYWASQQITTSTEDTPTLSNCGTSSYNVITYADADGHIHYRYQNSDGSWSTYNRLSTMIPGASINKSPTICGMSSDGSVHVAWVRYDNSSGYPTSPRIYYTKNSSANGTWPYQYWSILTEDEYNPSLAALASNKIDLLFTNGYNYLKYSRFNGSSWSSPVAKSTSAFYPSVSSGSSTAKYVYTYGTLSPFSVTLSSETLNKANVVEGTYTRSIAILDSSGAYVELQLHNMYYKKKDGSKQKIDFSSVTLDSTNVITTSNCWSFLSSTSDNLIPADAEDIVLNYTINTENADKLFENSSSPIEIEFQLQGGNKQSTKQLKQFTLANNKLSEKNEETILLSELPVVKGKDKGFISLGIKGLNPKKGTFASLGHLFDFTSSGSIPKEQETSTIIPTQYELQNYPNPFNPTTKISFSLPQKSQIKLKVFDVLGREIRVLADGIYEAGKHEVEFNASNLSSGVYFYNLSNGKSSITKKMLLIK